MNFGATDEIYASIFNTMIFFFRTSIGDINFDPVTGYL